MQTAHYPRLIGVLVLALWMLAACGGDDPTPAAASLPAEAPATTPAATTATTAAATAQPASADLPADPKAAILQALRGQLTAGPHRITTTITGGDGAQTATTSVVPPDRLHIVMDLGGMAMEMIYIGDQVWTKQGEAAWEVSDSLGDPGTALLDEAMIADTEQTITVAALVGPERVDGVDALLYTFTTDLSKSTVMPMESTMESKIWIDTATGLVIRQETTDSTAGAPTLTVQEIEYDATVTVEPPQ